MRTTVKIVWGLVVPVLIRGRAMMVVLLYFIGTVVVVMIFVCAHFVPEAVMV